MLFTDYLKKCLEDEEFRKEWESLDESLKTNYYVCSVYGGYNCQELLADNIEVYAETEEDAKDKAVDIYKQEYNYSVEDNSYGLCAKINNNESLEEAYITLPESAQYDLEDRLLKIGFTLDDETSRYGSKNEYKSWHDDGTYNIHYQIITKDKFDETNWKYKVDELSDLLDLFEEDYDCVTTLNAALIDDGRITAGFDVRDCWVADEGTDQIAPPKPEKLTFIDGELEDTDDNKYVIDNITSHMDLSKDDIVNAIVGKKNKKVEESWDEKVELEYTNLPITYVKVKPSYDWREPDDEVDMPIEIDYTYEVYKDDVIYEIANILLDESSKFDSYDDDSLNAYIEEHFDELLDKYYTKITDRFRVEAIEDAEQNYDAEEEGYFDIDYDDYDESLNSNFKKSKKFKLRESEDSNVAIDAMLQSFNTQEDSYIGPFWYDPNKKEVYGEVLTLASDRPFYKSKQWNKEVRTSNALHQNIWKKEQNRGKDNRFQGNYTIRPRGRVFEFKDEGFKVFTGAWIDKCPEAKEIILDVFQLPEDKTEFIKDEHWDIGHGWSDEF